MCPNGGSEAGDHACNLLAVIYGAAALRACQTAQRRGKVDGYSRRVIEAAGGYPFFTAGGVNPKFSTLEASREFLSALDAVVHVNEVDAGNVAHLADMAHFDKYNMIPVVTHGHASFENYVESWLACWFQLVPLVVFLSQVWVDISNVVRGEQDDDGA